MRCSYAALAAVVGGLAVAVVTAQPPAAVLPPISPDAILVLVAADLVRLSAEEAKYSRYQTLRMGATAEERDTLARLATAHLHELSGAAVPMPLITERQASEGAIGVVRVGDSLLRFNTKYLGKTFQEQWERLGAQEPYWHGENLEPVETEEYETVTVEYGYWTDAAGQNYTGRKRAPGDKWTTTRKENEKKRKVAKNVRGFFVRTEEGKKAFLEIQKRMVDPRSGSYGTDVPVVDADWFWGQTTIDYKRDPGYRKFVGFENRAQFEKIIGLVRDPKVINETFLQEVRAVVSKGSRVVTPQTMRRIVTLRTVAGDAWFTLDANQEAAKNKAKANPAINLGDGYEHQAEEWLSPNALGFIAKALFNAEGAAQDFAPPEIASDDSGSSTDKRVHNGLCLRCHVSYQPITDWARGTAQANRNFLAIKDRGKYSDDELFLIRQQYVKRLEPILERSRARYAEALLEVTGWTPAEYSDAIGSTWKKHVEGDVGVEYAARRLGTTTEQFQAMLTAKPLSDKMKAEGKTEAEIRTAVLVVTQRMDPMLSAFRPDAKEELSAVVWQQTFQRAADVVSGVVRPFDIREGK